ncbi:MAG TPA: radical SAM/SPASM domain-containing protein [Bdellovibrionota bacterium]|jgi:pyruvate-formate lyase-activating enzyme
MDVNGGNLSFDWLEPKKGSEGLSWSGFGEIKPEGELRRAWSISEKCELEAPRSTGHLYFTFVVPQAGTTVEVLVGDKILSTRTSAFAWQEVSGKVECGPGLGVSFITDCWNGKPDFFLPSDHGAMALYFKTLKFAPLSSTKLPVQSKKICTQPFMRMEVYSPNFVPCCSWWLKEELAFEGNEGELWNSGAAQALRKSVLEGTYEFCRMDVCNATLVEKEELLGPDSSLSPKNREAVAQNKTELPDGPGEVTLISDSRCNLACPSCRKGHITDLSARDQSHLAETDRLMEKYGDSIEHVTLATNGEVFFSPYLRNKVKEAGRNPKLKGFTVHSNGLLFDEKSFDQLKPGSEKISRVVISVDAGDASTYQKVRGGDWNRLTKNLRWLSEKRAAGDFSEISLAFVVQKENFRSLPDFLSLAENLRVDHVRLSRVLPWTEAGFVFAEQNIFAPEHTDHGEFQALWASCSSKSWPFRLWSSFEGQA